MGTEVYQKRPPIAIPVEGHKEQFCFNADIQDQVATTFSVGSNTLHK